MGDSMNKFKVTTSTLEGLSLDHFVAVALGWKIVNWGDKAVWVQASGEGRFRCNVADWHPSTNPAQAWPIIEREGITTSRTVHGFWEAYRRPAGLQEFYQVADTALIAAMRCFVASKLGEEFVSTL